MTAGRCFRISFRNHHLKFADAGNPGPGARRQREYRIIPGVTRPATLVDPVDDEIGAIQLIKADDLLIRAHTTQPRYRVTPAPLYSRHGNRLRLATLPNATAYHRRMPTLMCATLGC